VVVLVNNDKSSTSMITDPKVRKAAISNILKVLLECGYHGVNVDFEDLPPWTRNHLTAFMTELREALAPHGLLVTMAVGPKWSDNDSDNEWSAAYDYAALAPLVDKMVIMTYDQHGQWSKAGPVASIEWVRRVVDYALSTISPEKILLGIAGYGYDWSSKGVSTVTADGAVALAEAKGSPIQWDDVAQAPYFSYVSNGVRHEVWFENSFSADRKVDLVMEKGLGGVALWSLGQEDARMWEILSRLKGDVSGSWPATLPRDTSPFKDLPPTHWAYSPIMSLYQAGAVSGCASGGFRPDEPVTRAELSKMIALAFGLNAEPDMPIGWADVSCTDWFHPYVEATMASGIMVGTEPGRFSPNRLASRQEVCVAVVRALGAETQTLQEGVAFKDASQIDGWAKDALRVAVASGLAKGYTDGTFKPRNPTTRAEAASVLARAKGLM